MREGLGLLLLAASPGCFRNLARLICDGDGDPPECRGTDGSGGAASTEEVGEASTLAGTSTGPGPGGSTGSGAGSTGSGAGSTGTDAEASAGESTGPSPFCGDGVVDPQPPYREECDPEDPAWAGRCNHLCRRDRVVFLASGTWNAGDLLGIEGANNYCVSRAGLAGHGQELALRFRAFLSDGTSDAVDRLHHSEGRYVLFDGTVVAENWEALLTEPLQHPIDLTELGGAGYIGAWTGMTHGTGRAVPGASHCEDWTTNSVLLTGHWGRTDAVDERWVFADSSNPTHCANDRSIYCIEQE
jgi:hypothetical protein